GTLTPSRHMMAAGTQRRGPEHDEEEVAEVRILRTLTLVPGPCLDPSALLAHTPAGVLVLKIIVTREVGRGGWERGAGLRGSDRGALARGGLLLPLGDLHRAGKRG